MKSAAWSPLRQSLFRALWIASVASYLGTAMHDLAAGWLMTSLTSSTILVALMQTASSLPIFLVAFPAGALADLVDRRRLLLVTQVWMLLAAALLGITTINHLTTAPMLLFLTFVLGVGGAMNAPAWQATTPELVSREDLPPAVALNGIGYNLARTFGPAIGGLVLAAAGTGAVFLLNAVSFIGVMIVLFRWKRPVDDDTATDERMIAAMRAGGRYVRHAPVLHAVLVRTAVFISCGSATWALMPVIGRHELHLSALGYGGMTCCFGLGAVVAATLLPRLRSVLSIDQLVGLSTILYAAFALGLALSGGVALVYFFMALGGMGWMALMATLNVAAQTSVPAWVRARALSVYLLVLQGGMAIGSVTWGAVADHLGVHRALGLASLTLVGGLGFAGKYRLEAAEKMDVAPSSHWADPELETEPHPADGPVLVTVEYDVAAENLALFAEAMRDVGVVRRRDGAYRWGLFSDVATATRVVETFVVESWAEHLRQHQRATIADVAMEERALAFHQGPDRPVVSHLISSYAVSLKSEE